MTNPTPSPSEAEPTDPRVSEQEFCARFKARMMKALPRYDGTEAELAAHADETAPTYYGMDEAWEETPEGWASVDISYWEEG